MTELSKDEKQAEIKEGPQPPALRLHVHRICVARVGRGRARYLRSSLAVRNENTLQNPIVNDISQDIISRVDHTFAGCVFCDTPAQVWTASTQHDIQHFNICTHVVVVNFLGEGTELHEKYLLLINI
jgi:hypothetical protein